MPLDVTPEEITDFEIPEILIEYLKDMRDYGLISPVFFGKALRRLYHNQSPTLFQVFAQIPDPSALQTTRRFHATKRPQIICNNDVQRVIRRPGLWICNAGTLPIMLDDANFELNAQFFASRTENVIGIGDIANSIALGLTDEGEPEFLAHPRFIQYARKGLLRSFDNPNPEPRVFGS